MVVRDANLTQKAILEAIAEQIETNDPPAVKMTMDRLMNLGISKDESLKYIACAFVAEVFDIMEDSREFDLDKYNENLSKLPEMPWDNEETNP